MAYCSARLVLYVQKLWGIRDHFLLHCPIAYELWSMVFFVCLVSIGLCHIKLLSCKLHGRESSVDRNIDF